MRLLVTGASGYFGRQILPSLLDNPAIASVVAVDLTAPSLKHAKLQFHAADLTQTNVNQLLTDITGVIHLAFVVERKYGEDHAALNLHAARRFVVAASNTVEVLVVASSVMAYGFRTEPFDRLTEECPPASGRGFYYAEEKQALERCLDELADSKARIVRARPCVVGGPTAPPFRRAAYQGKFLLMPRTKHPLRFQMLHEADLGPAFSTLLNAPSGVYNIAPDDEITTLEAAHHLGIRPIALPMRLCTTVMDLSWRLGLGHLDGSWAKSLSYPTHVVDNRKLRALGWSPRYTSRDTLTAMRNG